MTSSSKTTRPDQFKVFFVEEKALGFAGRDGQGLGGNGIAHVGLVFFAQDDIGFAAFSGEYVRDGDAFGLA